MFKEITNYSNYLIYDDGRVYSKYSRKFLTPRVTDSGYLTVDLYSQHQRKNFRIHRLVAQTFLPNPMNLPEINHKDENKQNNHVDNLEWCDSKYNINYGTRSKKMKTNKSKKIRCIETNIIYPSIKEAQQQLHIFNISQVCHGKQTTAGGYHWEFINTP